jgi:hypothetical protein
VSCVLIAGAAFFGVGAPAFAQSQSAAIAIPNAALPAAPVPQPNAPSAAPAAAPAAPLPAPQAETAALASRIGFGAHLSTLGPGVDLGFRIAPNINIRGGFNYFDITENFTSSGASYSGTVKFESGEAHLDYYFLHSVHVSPGILFSNGTLASATIGVPGGSTFTVNHDTYTSDESNPLGGTASLKFNKVAPSIMIGLGNLVPAGRHHFSVRLEVGGAFRGTPTVAYTCQSAATSTQFQSDVAAQTAKTNNDISFLKFYPVLSLGFGFRL